MLEQNTTTGVKCAMVGETHLSNDLHLNVLLKKILFLLKSAQYFITFSDMDPTRLDPIFLVKMCLFNKKMSFTNDQWVRRQLWIDSRSWRDAYFYQIRQHTPDLFVNYNTTDKWKLFSYIYMTLFTVSISTNSPPPRLNLFFVRAVP